MDRLVLLQFRESTITSDVGLLPRRDLEDAFGLTDGVGIRSPTRRCAEIGGMSDKARDLFIGINGSTRNTYSSEPTSLWYDFALLLRPPW